MSSNNIIGGKQAAERRMSGSSATLKSSNVSGATKENRKPLQVVMSEEGPSSGGMSSVQCSSSNNQPVRPSFLSKLTRNEGNKIGSNVGPAATIREQQQSDQFETKCDKPSSYKDTKNDLETVDHFKQAASSQRDTHPLFNKNPSANKFNMRDKQSDDVNEDDEKEEEEEDDDDNQVIPSWPSKGDAAASANRANNFVQHKVYSLKDYSQVASPSPPTHQAPTTSGGSRLLKSLSQDRRVMADGQGRKGQTESGHPKRLSECPYPGFDKTTGPRHVSMASAGSKQPTPAVGRPVTTPSSASFSMGAASSINSLLPTNSRHAALMSESRIDRMRKLFVSPLSLRSGGTKVNQPGASSQIGNHPNARLSLQSGSSMLNKPHHLMHAIYRTGAGGAHHSRRSPMRQKQDIYKQQSVPYVLARLCNYIEENSSQLTHEGDAPLESESVDVATSASMLKMYLRELPEPLIPTRMNYYFITLAKKYSPFLTKENAALMSKTASSLSTSTSVSKSSVSDLSIESQAISERQRITFSRDLTKLLRKLPIENYNLLKYLACFLYRISLKQQYNKMCAEALGIVFGPNVFRIRSESYKGLKEQELSNQIMASIISNYKCIFDSELTDPLGNLVEVSPTNVLDVIGDIKSSYPIKGSKKSGLAGNVDGADLIGADSCPNNSPGISSVPSTSTATITVDDDSLRNDNRTRSPRSDYLFAGDEIAPSLGVVLDREDGEDGLNDDEDADKRLRSDEREELDDEEVDNEDEDLESEEDDCEQSYTPSSGSGSYCSSMDSETLESSYEHDNDNLGPDDNDLASQSNLSSSECASDISYTPTSSHTDSDLDPNENEESLYGQSSSFESSPSFVKLADPTLENNAGEPTVQQSSTSANVAAACSRISSQFDQGKKGCLVCKRRESAAAQIGLQRDTAAGESTSACDRRFRDKVKERRSMTTDAQDVPAAANEQRPDRSPPSNTKDGFHNLGQTNQVAQTKHSRQEDQSTSRRTSRKRRQGSQKKSPGLDESVVAEGSVEQTPSSQHLPNHLTQSAVIKTGQQQITANKSRHLNQQSGHKFDFLRRRSSSASSLSRIKHKRDRIAQHRKTLKVNEAAHRTSSTTRSHIRAASKLQDARGSQSSTRRSKGRTHLARKLTDHLPEHIRASRQSSARTVMQPPASRHSGRARVRSESYYGPVTDDNVSALNLPTHLLVDNDNEPFLSGWDFLSAQYLEELEYDRYFMLRPFNSDETLLRSLSYCSELAAQERAGIASKPRRRFSGHDFENKVNFVQVCRPCDQIFEGYEDEVTAAAVAAAAMGLTDPASEEMVAWSKGVDRASSVKVEKQGDYQQQTGTQPVEAHLESSCVSLLDNNRLPGFRRSELSITAENDHQGDDSILVQVKAITELVAALRRLLKFAPTSKHSKSTRLLLTKLAESDYLNAYSDDCFACSVDYLSALSVVEQLDEGFAADIDDVVLEEIDLAMLTFLEAAITSKISSLKQRYKDLKNIREHYLKNHQPILEISRVEQEINEQSDLSEAVSRKVHGSLDTLRPDDRNLCENSCEDGRERKLSAPSEDPAAHKELDQSDDEGSEIANQEQRQRRSSKRTGSVRRADDANGAHKITSTKVESFKTSDFKLTAGSSAGADCRRDRSPSGCRFGSLCPVEFVFNIEKQLASKRSSGDRMIKLNEMSVEQLQSEKLELQKNLLRYEHWFGRPVTRLECSLVGHLYERYRAVKLIKSRKQQSQEEERDQVKEKPPALEC